MALDRWGLLPGAFYRIPVSRVAGSDGNPQLGGDVVPAWVASAGVQAGF